MLLYKIQLLFVLLLKFVTPNTCCTIKNFSTIFPGWFIYLHTNHRVYYINSNTLLHGFINIQGTFHDVWDTLYYCLWASLSMLLLLLLLIKYLFINLYFYNIFHTYIIYLYSILMLSSQIRIIVGVYNTLLYAFVNLVISSAWAPSANFK